MSDWQERAKAATRGTRLGAIIDCALRSAGEVSTEVPRFVGKAAITSDGFVICHFIDGNGNEHLGALVGEAEDLVRNIRGLANHLHLYPADRQAMFRAVQNWIAIDYRAAPGLGLDKG